jgi:hypothetical protein
MYSIFTVPQKQHVLSVLSCFPTCALCPPLNSAHNDEPNLKASD